MRDNVAGGERPERDGRERITAIVFSSTTHAATVETPITETHPQKPINSYGGQACQQAFPHYERAAHPGSHCGSFSAASADPDGELGETISGDSRHPPRDPPPHGEGLRVFSDGRHVPAAYIHVTTWRCARALQTLSHPPDQGIQPQDRHAAVGARRHQLGRARHGQTGAVDAGAAAAGDPVLCVTDEARRGTGWTPKSGARRHREDRWAWRSSHRMRVVTRGRWCLRDPLYRSSCRRSTSGAE